MPRSSTDSFIVDVPLRTAPDAVRALAIRLDAARHLQNAVTGECLRILGLMRESRDWRRARCLPPGSVERRAAFKACIERFDFKSSMADRFAIACKNACWIRDHMSSNETQKAASRAFQAVAQHAFGKRGRPRFRRHGEVNSVEGKSNKAGIRWNREKYEIEWAGLTLPAIIDQRDRWLVEALRAPTKYCRLVRREIRGVTRYSVQLVQDGVSPPRHVVRPGIVGIDVGPSTIAAVSAHDAMLAGLCPTIDQPWRELRRLERSMERSKRASNPDAYEPDFVDTKGRRRKGKLRKGARLAIRSNRYRTITAKRRERERRLAAERKIQHGELVSRILAQGTVVKAEKLSYRAFQKTFGRSTKVRGVGLLVEILRRRAREAGGGLVEFSTCKTRLSQFDHTTGDFVKKPLSQRVHVLRDGSGEVQRDLYSAFLARFVGAGDLLDAREAAEAFPGAKPLLVRAASGSHQPASGGGFPHPRGHQAARAGRTPKGMNRTDKVPDDVTTARGGEGREEFVLSLQLKTSFSCAQPAQKPPGFIPGVV